MEVVIPPKRDKYGRRFGFARFRDVNDYDFFATKLDNIIIGATKIHVNIPRFPMERFREKQPPGHVKGARPFERRDQRSHQSVEGERVNDPKGKKKVYEGEMEGINEKESAKRREGEEGSGKGAEVCHEAHGSHKPRGNAIRQFGKHGQWKGRKEGRRPRKEAFKGLLCYDVDEDDIAKFQKMYIGYVKQPGTTYSVQQWFSRQGVFSVKITPLGPSSVLMEDALMNDAKDWLLERFEDIKPWQPFVVDNERLVWVKCHGIPPHAWGEGICKLMANTMGSYVYIDEDTMLKRSLDIAWILIRTRGFGVINRVFISPLMGVFLKSK